MSNVAARGRILFRFRIAGLVGFLLSVPLARGEEKPAKTGGSIFDFGSGGAPPAGTATTKATTPAGKELPAQPGGKTVQVLKLVDAQAARVNRYQLRDGVLVGHDDGASKMTLPYAPAAEYDLAVDFVRTSGNADVAIAFPVGRFNCNFNVGGNFNANAWLGLINNSWADAQNPTFTPFSLENGRAYHAVVKVRRAGVEAFIDGKLVCQYQTDGHDLCANRSFASRSSRLLAVSGYRSVVEFRAIEVTNVSGTGLVATERAEDGRPISPVAVVPNPAGGYDLTANDATAHGMNIVFQRSIHTIGGVEKNPPGLRNFGGWNDGKDYLSWIVDVQRAGDYTVTLTHACPPGQEGSEVAVTFDGEAPLPFTVESTGGWHEFRTVELGVVSLPVGKVTIALKASRKPHSYVMDAEGITLVPKKAK